MARKPKKNKKNSGEAADQAKRQLLLDAGGYDWGWPALGVISANPELIRRLAVAGFVGCGYGFVSQGGPPFIALVGEDLSAMKSVLALMREWTDVVGPNAIAVEILLNGPGYIIAIAQQHDLLRWRLRGLDTTDRSLVMTMCINKRLDTRQPFLEDLAHYSRQPIAPVVLTVAGLPPGAKSKFGSLDTAGFAPMMDGAITLPGINVYLRPEDRPRDSMIKLESEIPDEPRRELPEQAKDPASMVRERERRLMSTFPKTMHVLRHRTEGRAVFVQPRAIGCADWQVEQGICNLRLAEYLPYQPRSASKRLAMLDQLRREFIEHASIGVEVSSIDPAALLAQIELDAAYLLRRIDEKSDPPEKLLDSNIRLRELGYA